jgi:hypothetical protein
MMKTKVAHWAVALPGLAVVVGANAAALVTTAAGLPSLLRILSSHVRFSRRHALIGDGPRPGAFRVEVLGPMAHPGYGMDSVGRGRAVYTNTCLDLHY